MHHSKHSLNPQNKSDPIKHVVLLVMENQSFDRIFGDRKVKNPEVEGVDREHPNFNVDNKDNKIYQQETQAVQMPLDPLHEAPDVHQQLSEKNGGFVKNFILNYPASKPEDHQSVMAFYPDGFLPALHPLADAFTLCDHWFASVPGPTWANRFYILSGTSNGRVKMVDKLTDFNHMPELFHQTQANLFDRLDEKGISWSCYSGDFPISLVLTHNREPQKLLGYHDMERFFEDAKGAPAQFPQFSFIEPRYLGNKQNDGHPPHNIMRAEQLIADVYNALRGNEELWKSTLFVLVFDEHGGFYDHVVPPEAVPPDGHHEDGFDFKQLGLRVPALLISPWAKKSLEKTVFDHTSLLKYLTEKWNLGSLGERTSHANSIGVALDVTGEPRDDCPRVIAVPADKLVSPNPKLEEDDENGNHNAIHAFADFLNSLNKTLAIPALPLPGKLAEIKDTIGRKLEHLGALKIGRLFRNQAQQYHQARIDHTLQIVGNKLCLFQPEKKQKASEVPDSNPVNIKSVTV